MNETMTGSLDNGNGYTKAATDDLDPVNYLVPIIDTLKIPVVLLDDALKIKFATPAFFSDFRLTKDQVIGKYFYKLNTAVATNVALIERLMNLLSDNIAIEDFEINCNTQKAIPDYFRINASIYLGPDHSKIMVVAINDISDWCSEKAALESENISLREKVVLTTESAHLGTWEMDTDTRTMTCDERCSKFFGNGAIRLSYEDFLESLHPDDRGYTEAEMRKAISGVNHGLYHVEHRTQFKKDQQLTWLRASGKAYFDDNGNAIRFAGTITDITLQKLNEQLLRESEERFRVAADAAAVLMWLSTPYKSRNYFNKSWFNFGGRKHQEEVGYGWKENIHADDVEQYMLLYETSFDQRQQYEAEYRLRHKDGVYRWISEVGAPRFSPAGIFEGFIGTCIDCHDQKRTREELENKVGERTQLLKNAILNLEASNQNLEEFAYVASHDLQEPLRKIQAFSDRLQHKNQHGLSDTTRLYLSKITGASDRMSHLIGDLLNYSKLKNTSDLLEITDLNQVVQNVLYDFDMSIQQKNAVINAENLPVIKATPMRMNQLFHNLVSNALKFAKEDVSPVISIDSHTLASEEKLKHPSLDPSTDYVVINFSDNGIGFNQEFAEKVFNIFQRLNGMSAYEGTGIGLAICRKIVINHHGLIFAESKENVGTRFRIIFPAYEKELES